MKPCAKPRTESRVDDTSGPLIRCTVRPTPNTFPTPCSVSLLFLASNNAESIMPLCHSISNMYHPCAIISYPTSFCSIAVGFVPPGSLDMIIKPCLCNILCQQLIIGYSLHRVMVNREVSPDCFVSSHIMVKQRISIGYEALISYLDLLINKTSKENLKPRKGVTNNVKFLQCNMQKSQHAQIDLNRRISKMNKEKEHFICCIQEPCSVRSKLISQPNTVQRFGKLVCPRTCIYTDTNTNAWFLEALSTKDITAL